MGKVIRRFNINGLANDNDQPDLSKIIEKEKDSDGYLKDHINMKFNGHSWKGDIIENDDYTFEGLVLSDLKQGYRYVNGVIPEDKGLSMGWFSYWTDERPIYANCIYYDHIYSGYWYKIQPLIDVGIKPEQKGMIEIFVGPSFVWENDVQRLEQSIEKWKEVHSFNEQSIENWKNYLMQAKDELLKEVEGHQKKYHPLDIKARSLYFR